MEYDNFISRIHGALVSLGKREILNNPDKKHEVISVLKEAMQDIPEEAKKRVTFFMVLNTNLMISEQLKDDSLVGHFTLGVETPIDENLLIYYIYELKLDSYFCRMVENCPAVLSGELIKVVVKKLNQPEFHKDEYGIEHLYRLLQSIFVKISKIQKGNHSWDKGVGEIVVFIEDVCELIKKVIIATMRIASDYIITFLGSHLVHFFRCVLFCLELRFWSLGQKDLDIVDDPIYELAEELPCNCSQIADPTKECINSLLKTLNEILENMTVDTWMRLVESYLDAQPSTSLQLVIGNLIYEIEERVRGCDVSSDLRACLSAFSIKPKSEEELMAEAGLEEIVANVMKERKGWFRTLARHPSLAQEEPLRCLINNIHQAEPEDVEHLLDISLEYVESHKEGEVFVLMKTLFLTLVRKSQDFSRVLEKVFQEYRPNLLTTDTTQDELVETFNKMSGERSIPLGDLVSLCLQAPLDTLRKICHLSLCNPNQKNFCVDVLKVLKPACVTHLDMILLNECLPEFTEKEKPAFIMLVGGLGEKGVLGVTFMKTLLKLLKRELDNNKMEAAVRCLEVVFGVFQVEAFAVDKVVLLVLMAEVLDRLSWDVWTFSPIKAVGKDLAGLIVASILKKLKNDDERKLNWARLEIEKCWEVTQAYFYDLWLLCGRRWVGSGALHSYILGLIHTERKARSMDRVFRMGCIEENIQSSIALAFITIFPILTFPECSSAFFRLADVLTMAQPKLSWKDACRDILDAFAAALYFLTKRLEQDGTIFPCYEQCLRHFGRLIQSHAHKMETDSAAWLLKRLLSLMEAIGDDDRRRSCSLILAPVLLELVDKTADTHYGRDIRNLFEATHMLEVSEAIARRLAPL